MAKTTVSIEIPASADAVWQLMGGFDALPDWLPFIPKSVVTEGGRVRSLTTSDGGTVVERLEAFDNRQRSYTPVNVTNEEAEALFTGIYRDGLKALKDNFVA